MEVQSIYRLECFKEALKKSLRNQAEKAHLKKYEYVKDFIVETDNLSDSGQGFSVENGLMTPTFKLRRPQLVQKYRERLEALYSTSA